jgi:hypothetical protein
MKTVKLKKLGVMALCIFLLTLAFSGVGNAAPEETQTVSPLDYGGLRIDITAPIQACPSENITVTVKTSARDVQQIHIRYITIDLYGVINATTKVYLDQIKHLSNVTLSSHETQYNVTIPNNISPGLTYGEVSCEWEALGASFEVLSSGFALTYVKDVALEQLQAEYDELNATHQSILEEYTELKSGIKEEVDSTRNLMYIFIATTVVASITVVVLLMRKPKKVWV